MTGNDSTREGSGDTPGDAPGDDLGDAPGRGLAVGLGGGEDYVIDLGPVAVVLQAAQRDLVEYLSGFYAVRRAGSGDETGSRCGQVQWEIDARLGAPDAGMTCTRWGVGVDCDPGAGRARVRGVDPVHLAITVRKMVREALVEFCGARAATMLHASAVTDGARVVIVVGDKGAGKTTLGLSAVLDLGWTLLSNDHLLLYRDHDATLVVTSLPTPIPVKTGTWCDWSHRLPAPWDTEAITPERARALPAGQRYRSPGRFLYTYRGLGQPHPLHTRLAERTVDVVLAGYGRAGALPAQPQRIEPQGVGLVDALGKHVRFDWWFGPANTHLLPRAERTPAQFAADSTQRLHDLAAVATATRWTHHGHLAPFLAATASRR